MESSGCAWAGRAEEKQPRFQSRQVHISVSSLIAACCYLSVAARRCSEGKSARRRRCECGNQPSASCSLHPAQPLPFPLFPLSPNTLPFAMAAFCSTCRGKEGVVCSFSLGFLCPCGREGFQAGSQAPPAGTEPGCQSSLISYRCRGLDKYR